MAVADTSSLSGLLQDPSVRKAISDAIPNILGDNTMADSTGFGGGALGAVLVGALLPRLFNDNNVAAAAHALTAADVQNIVSSNTNSATLGNVSGEIWKAEGQVQAALAASSSTSSITNLQGQIALLSAVDSSGDAVSANVALVGTAVAGGNSSILANLNQLNTNILQSTYQTAQTITNDGDKTRALIQNIETSSLNRQITVAQNEIAELRHRDAVTNGGVTVTNNINQTAVANANAVAQQQIVGLLGTVAAAIQHNTQSTVNLGTMIGSGQTATNVKA